MKSNNVKALVLDGPGRQILPIIKGLHECKCHITTLNYSKLDVGYASRYPRKKILEKNIENNLQAIIEVVEKELKTGTYDVLIPLSDSLTELIAKRKDDYLKYIKPIVPSYDIFIKAYDKQKTMEICQKIGVANTLTRLKGESVVKFIEKVKFPIVLKPRRACGSVGFHCVRSEEELRLLLDQIDFEEYVMQEYIQQSGKQFNVHLFMDSKGELSFAVPTEKCRWFPTDGGASCFCRIVEQPSLIEPCKKLLREIQWQGYCEIELIEDTKDGIIKIIEINGRPSASIKICELGGINVVKNMLELAYDKPVTHQKVRFQDMRMRCIHTDLLWLFKSTERWKARPIWFNNRHTHDQIFSISDPWPFVTFSIAAFGKYKKEMEKRRR